MSVDKVKEYFAQYGMENQVLEFDQSSATVELAAKTLGCEAGRIAKTLSFMLKSEPLLILTAGDVKIDNAKYKACFGAKAKMMNLEELELFVGHQAGGVCPFALNKPMAVYLDNSLKKYDYVFPACGSSNSAIKLSIPELEKFSLYRAWIDVCKEKV